MFRPLCGSLRGFRARSVIRRRITVLGARSAPRDTARTNRGALPGYQGQRPLASSPGDVRGLRIAHLIESDGPGGAERVVVHLATALQAAGAWNVVFLPPK